MHKRKIISLLIIHFSIVWGTF